MNRIRLLFAVVAVFLMLGAPAFAQTEDVEDEPRMGPAVIVEEDVAAPEEEAWTFRYLVPTLIAATGIAVTGVAIGYAVRIRSRYRVVE